MIDFQTTTEIVRRAHELLAPPEWDYIAGGALTETTVRRNREAIDAWAFRPRILRNVAVLDPATALLGTKLRIPYLLAPVGSLQAVVAEGGAAQVRAATAFGTLPVISSVCQPDLETCARAAAGDKWFQLYCRGAGFEWVATMANRVREAGYRALVITVDSAYYGIRERQVLSRWSPPARRRRNAGGDEYLAALDWDTVDRIKAVAQIPVVLKGIQSGDDAAIALERGIDAIWISNHGGRQPDHALGSIEVLPDVVARVGGKIPIVVDGGFMRGTDVLKAIALGATAVATGRLQALALAAGAEEGCVRMLEILEDEITTAMALLGVTSLTKLDHSYLHHSPLSSPAPAFPHLPPAMRP